MRVTLFSLLFITVALSNAQTVISLNDTTYSVVTMPRRDVEEVDDGIIVTYHFDNAIIQQDILYPECVMWKIPEFGLNETAGEPSIPFRWDSFALPENTTINLEVLDTSYIDFSMQLSPARPILVDSDTIEHTLENVFPITPYNGFFPTSLVESFRGNAYRGVPLLEVGVSPLQYNYNQQVVRAYKMIKYKITFLSSYRNRSVSTAIDFNDHYLSITTINPSIPAAQAPGLGQSTEAKQANRNYLIVTNSTLRSAAEEFAEWKRTLGFRTSVVVKDDWSTQAVKDTIAQYYNKPNNNLYYLLILGDESVVPATECVHVVDYHILGIRDTFDCITDLYYACMGGIDDFVSDVYYGRIPTNNAVDAKNVFDKIRAYEEIPTTDTLFYRTGLNCAYFQDDGKPKNYADRRFAQTSEEILQYVTSQGKTVNRVYYTKNKNTPLCWNDEKFGFGDSIPTYLQKPAFDWKGKASDIINYINKGAFYVLHRDHGMPTYWVDPFFNKNHISQLTNQNKLPVVFSINCHTGRYHESSTTDCFAEAFLKKSDGGCVAIYAATGTSFSGYNDALAIGMFNAIWPTPGLRFSFPGDSILENITPPPSPTYELGQVLEVGMARMQETWGAIPETERYKFRLKYTRELFHVFGDPSMQIYTDYPTSIQDPEVCRIGDTIFVKVKDGEARIAFYTPSSNQVDTYYGTNVNYQTVSDDVVICISRHNNIPYITHSNKLVYIQNEIINNNRDYIGETIKVGRNVTDKKVYGDVIVNNGNVSITGKRVELQSGTKITQGAVLKINNP